MSQKNATAEDLQRLGMWLTVEEPQLRRVGTSRQHGPSCVEVRFLG